jgi:hypothetical protein
LVTLSHTARSGDPCNKVGSDDTALLDADAVGASASVDAYDDGLVHSHTWAVQSLDR